MFNNIKKRATAASILLAALVSGGAYAQTDAAASAAFASLTTEFALYLTAGFTLLAAVMVGFIGLKWLRMFANKST